MTGTGVLSAPPSDADDRETVRALPLHGRHRALGAQFEVADGWRLPACYQEPIEEHRAARERAGLSDVSHQGLVVLRGPDRRAFLDGLLSNDILHLPPFHGTAACLLTPAGTMVTDLAVYNRGDDLLCLLRPEGTAPFVTTVQTHLPLSSSSLEQLDDGGSVFFLTGPLHAEVLAAVLGSAADVPPGGCGGSVWRGHSLLILSYPSGAPCDHLVGVPAEAAEPFLEKVLRIGQAFGLRLVGRQAQEILRVEAGRPLMGVDMNASSYPMEVNLDGAVSDLKGPHLGRDAIARVKSAGGPWRQLVGLETEDLCARGDDVVFDGDVIGKVTSAVRSPCLGAGLALATLRGAHVPGERLSVVCAKGPQRAEVVQLPVAA